MKLFKREEKERPDILKNEAPKPGYIRFWQLYFRNFSKMVGYGSIYFVVALLIVCGVFLNICAINPEMLTSYVGSISDVSGIEEAVPSSWVYLIGSLVFAVPWYIRDPLIVLALIVNGPLTCGMVYCMRNHANEEHAWFSDVFIRAWRNKWQGLLIGCIDALVLFGVVMYAFGTDTLGMSGGAFAYLKFVSYGIGIVWLIMRLYVYQMTVTFNLKLKGMLKNAWMFVILGFGRNLLTLICVGLLTALVLLFPLYYPVTMPFFLVMIALVYFGLEKFMSVFLTYPIMFKYLVYPAKQEQKRADAVKRSAELRARRDAGEEIDTEELAELERFLADLKKKH